MLLGHCREDEYELSFVYGPEATNRDVHARSIGPLLQKLVGGHNVAVVLFGATGDRLEGLLGDVIKQQPKGPAAAEEACSARVARRRVRRPAAAVGCGGAGWQTRCIGTGSAQRRET